MPKKEEKDKKEEAVEEKTESETAEKESQPEPSKEPAGSEQIISEASVQLPTDEPTTPKTNISMDPIATPAGETTVPAVGPVATPAAQSGVPAVDETVAEKPTQETYPLADEIEKDAQKKRSLLSALLIFRNKKGKIILLCLVALLLVALAAGTILNSERDKLSFMNRNNKPRETVVLSPTQAPTATPVPAEVDKKTLKIEVQNGTGESGVAGKMKNLLVEKGYEGTIETGNADNYDYTETVLKIKKTKIGIQKELETDLSDDYTLSKSVENLEDDSDYDVVVIVGAE